MNSQSQSQARSDLRPRIAIIAPSGRVWNRPALNRAASHLTSLGFTVEASDAVFAEHQRFAGTDQQRAGAFMQAVQSGAQVVLAARGGYGLSRLMSVLDWSLIATAIHERGTMLVGQSDFTAVHLALLARAGAVSFAGPMACEDFGAEQVSSYTEAHFRGVLGQAQHVVGLELNGDQQLPVSWSAEGVLWGGNLAMVCSLLGSPWWPDVKHGLLFLEDVNEHPFRIERMLLQLLHAGVLQGQRAVLLGEFSDYRLGPIDQGFDLPVVIAELRSRLAPYGVPVLTGLPFGHGRDKLTLPVGAMCELRRFRHQQFEFVLNNPLRIL